MWFILSFKSFTNFPNFPASLIQNNWYYYPMDKSLSNGQHSMPERYLSVEWHFPPFTQLDLGVQLYLKIYLTNKIRGTYRSQSQCILMRGSCFAYSLIRKIYTEDRTGNNLYYISLEDLYTSYTYVARIHTVRVKLRYFSNYIHEQTMLWIIGHFRYVKIQTWLHGLLE